jgi:hypothetical protein
MKHRDEFPKLFNRLGYRFGAEVGTQRGLFAEHLLKNCSSLEMLHCIDIWKQQPKEIYNDVANGPDDIHELHYEQTLERLNPFANRYNVLRMWSVDAAELIEEELLDFVYIDANHSYKCTTEDLEAWYPKVRPGGMMCGHDYLDSGTNFGVYSAVQDFTRNLKVKVHSTQEQWPSWYFIKED